MITVMDILSIKPRAFNVVEPEALVEDALHLLGAVNLSFLVVMHNQAYQGIFCEHDFLHNVAMRGWDPKTCLVKDTMTTGLPTLNTTDSLEHCMQLFTVHKIKYLPAFNLTEFAGIITTGDILRATVSKRHEIFDDVAQGAAQDFSTAAF